MFCERSRRRSPSTISSRSIRSRSLETSSSVRSRTLVSGETPASPRSLLEVARPMPKMYVRPISTRLFSGMLMPAIRAIACALPLPLLVTGVRADDQHAPVAADDLALLAHRLDRRSYLHDPFRLVPVDSALAAGTAAATTSRTSRARQSRATPSATMKNSKVGHRTQRHGRTSGRGPAAVLVPRRQHARTLGGDRDGELEVGGERAILREDRPVVVGHPHLVPAGR